MNKGKPSTGDVHLNLRGGGAMARAPRSVAAGDHGGPRTHHNQAAPPQSTVSHYGQERTKQGATTRDLNLTANQSIHRQTESEHHPGGANNQRAEKNHGTAPEDAYTSTQRPHKRSRPQHEQEGGEGKKTPAHTQVINNKSQPSLIIWVLLSTMCVYTHHTIHPSISTCIANPPSYPTQRLNLTIYLLPYHLTPPIYFPNYSAKNSTHFAPHRAPDLPSKLHNATQPSRHLNLSAASQPPTPHKHIHTEVNTKTHTYQHLKIYRQHRKHNNTLFANLPPAQSRPHKELHPKAPQLPLISNTHRAQNTQPRLKPQTAAKTPQKAPNTHSSNQNSQTAIHHNKPKPATKPTLKGSSRAEHITPPTTHPKTNKTPQSRICHPPTITTLSTTHPTIRRTRPHNANRRKTAHSEQPTNLCAHPESQPRPNLQIPSNLTHPTISHSLNTLHLPLTPQTIMATTNTDLNRQGDLHNGTQAGRTEVADALDTALDNRLRNNEHSGMQVSWPSEQTARKREATASKHSGEMVGAPRRMSVSRSGSRLHNGNNSRMQPGSGSRIVPEAHTQGPTTGREGAENGHKPAEETSRHGSSKQRGSISTRSASRRRALIQAFSDEEEENDLPRSQPIPLRVKTTPYHDADIDMQLDNVTPERGGSSLQISVSQEEHVPAPHRAAMMLDQLDTINLADATPPPHPHQSPRKESVNDTQSAKRRRSEVGGHPHNSGSSTYQRMRTKEAIPSIDIVSHMWLGFSIHEAIATQRGTEVIYETRSHEEFEQLGTPPMEIIEFKTLRRAFPRVPQVFYPNERPDAVPGNHLHFTQLPKLEKADPTTGLSEGFQVTIRFDYGFKGISRQDARGACIDRLRQMDIPLGKAYSNPIDIGLNAITKSWAGFIKIHLLHPQRDGLALLQGSRAFVMKMDNNELVIGKVEKGYELATKARNLRLHLKGESLRHEFGFDILQNIVRGSYYAGKPHEFMGLAKPELDKYFVFLTLTTEDARDLVLKEGLIFNHEVLQVSITRDRSIGNPSEFRISTTLVANNLPQRETQTAITRSIRQVFGTDNIVGFSFGANNPPHTDRQAGWCHIQCLNAAVYTEWLHKSTIILGRRVDFIPHRGSIDGSDPNNTAIRLAQAPVREAIADKVQAMNNVTNPNPLITERYLTKTMKDFEEKLEEKFGTLTTSINEHTDRKIETTTASIAHHTSHLQALLGTIAHEFQQSNLRMQGLVNGLAAAAPDIIQRSVPPPMPQGSNVTAPPLPLQAPPGFHGNPTMHQQGHYTFNG